MNRNNPIFVTQPFLPPLAEYNEYLKKIWENKWLTNNGVYHQELEKAICKFLGVKYISLFSNGTLALMTALQTLEIKGEVITTPFSFVATTHALWWNNITPVFADIDEDSFNLDPIKIESAITSRTEAILPVHVYGNPCNVEKISEIAVKHNLKVIYDAAHAFGVNYNGKSVANLGDLSVLSFHATKVFNTFEGGAIVCHDKATKQKIDYLKNFGFADEVSVVMPGINGKMNEVQAAMGLLQLKYFEANKVKRFQLDSIYRNELCKISGIGIMAINHAIEYNYGYFPVTIDRNVLGITRDDLYEKLKERGIYTRRYFYPLISSFQTYNKLSSANNKNLKTANKVAEQILCLPIYSDLSLEDVGFIITEIKNIIGE